MEFASSSQPNFVVVFIPEISTTTLKIPAHIPVVLQGSVNLRDMYKNIWPVESRKVDGHWYLMDGWAKFVADSSLIMMDVLDFHYSGPGSLDVYILDTNGDMKKGVGYRKIDNPKEHQNMEADESEEFEVVCRENAKFKEEGEELRKFGNDKDASGSRKPQHKKRNVDCLSKEIHKYGLASMPKRSYSVKRMKPIESYKGKGILSNVSGNEEEGDSEEEFIELTPRNDQKGKGRVKKELRADSRTYTAASTGISFQKRRNINDCRGNKIITSSSTPLPKIPSPAAKMPPRRMNDTNNRGKGIMHESSDKDSDSDYWSYDSNDEISEKDFVSGINGLQNARDAKAPKRGSAKFDYLGNKIFESGVIPWPTCKYFITKMKSDELRIPEDIVMDENIQLPKTIMLVDPNHYAYPSLLTSGTDGGRIYKQGWEKLCRENKLTEEDFCICEFGEWDGASLLFISIVRLAH